MRAPYGVLVTNDPAPFDQATRLPLVAGEGAAGFARRILAAVPHGARPAESTIGVVRVDPFDAVVMHVKFHPDGRLDVLREAHPTLPVALVLGWPFADDAEMATITRRLTTELRTQPSEPRMIAMARDVLALGAARSPKIGGPSHVQVLDAVASGGPVAWNGTGFWLDATSTPTFRVGDPSGNRITWDGTNLTVGQGTVTIDSTGITVTAAAAGRPVHRREPVLDHHRGIVGALVLDDAEQRAVVRQAQRAQARVGVGQAREAIGIGGHVVAAGLRRTSGSALIQMLTGHNAASIVLNTTIGASPYTGTISLGGIPNFQGATSGSAGALAGYVNVTVAGTAYRLPIYNP